MSVGPRRSCSACLWSSSELRFSGLLSHAGIGTHPRSVRKSHTCLFVRFSYVQICGKILRKFDKWGPMSYGTTFSSPNKKVVRQTTHRCNSIAYAQRITVTRSFSGVNAYFGSNPTVSPLAQCVKWSIHLNTIIIFQESTDVVVWCMICLYSTLFIGDWAESGDEIM